MEMLQEALTSLLITVMVGAIGVAGTYATIYFNKMIENAKVKTEQIKNENLKSLTNDALDRVNDLVVTNVIKAQQTSVKEIMAGVEDGTFDKEDLRNVAVAVKNDVLKQMGGQVAELLTIEIGDVEGYIEALIETKLAQLKGQV